MPTIHVTCPACRSVLELDAEHAGREIECGSCLKVFVARPDDPPAASRSGRSRRRDDDEEDRERRRRRDDEEDDDYRPARRSDRPANGLAVTSLVLGCVSIVLIVALLPIACVGGCCCAPLAWLPLPVTVPLALGAVLTGAAGVRRPDGRGMAVAGIVLGSLALGVAVLQLAFGFLPFLVVAQPPAR